MDHALLLPGHRLPPNDFDKNEHQPAPVQRRQGQKVQNSQVDAQENAEIEDIQDLIERLQDQLKGEQDRYISQFTTMESLLNKMNTQSSYLSQLSG